MAKSRKQEEVLDLIAQLRQNPTADAAIEQLHQLLNSKYSIAVAQTAKLIGDFELRSLIPDLVSAFARLMIKPETSDAGCFAKFRIAEALYRMECAEEDLFLQGIRHRQMEPVWGGRQDTACQLRGVCALGLVRMHYSAVMSELADLLADPEPIVRAAAIRAIAYSENDRGIPLLRFKAHIGDRDPQVMSDCFAALLQLDPTRSLPLVASFLNVSEVQLCEMAALAIGESRSEGAFSVLQQWLGQRLTPDLRRIGVLAIATLRSDAALSFLIQMIAEGPIADAQNALSALTIYRQDTHLWQRVCQTVEQRGNPKLIEELTINR